MTYTDESVFGLNHIQHVLGQCQCVFTVFREVYRVCEVRPIAGSKSHLMIFGSRFYGVDNFSVDPAVIPANTSIGIKPKFCWDHRPAYPTKRNGVPTKVLFR